MRSRLAMGYGRLVGLVLLGTAGLLQAAELPRIAGSNGHYQLLVDGKPYLVLGGQIHNSSAWPSMLPNVWSSLEQMYANTVEAPVYWELMEPEPGKFNFDNVDELIKQARVHRLHVILLWFGTWKNGNMHYVPEWIKTDTARYPRMQNAHAELLDVLAAESKNNLEADRSAFRQLMRHLKQVDGEAHTVVMVQVENESGAIGTVRNYSPEAEQLFAGAVPGDLKTSGPTAHGTWRQMFGGDADEYFQAYQQARYINAVAEAGKAEYALPMYINVWLTYPVAELPERRYAIPGQGYPSGGAVQKMVSFWKLNAPSIDLIAPDIYSDRPGFVAEVMRAYARPDNAFMVPEIGSGDSFAKYFFSALGNGALGFAPFGVDRNEWSPRKEGESLHAQNYRLFAPAAREVARLVAEGKVKTAVEEKGKEVQEIDLGGWQAQVSFGFPQRDGMPPPGTDDLHGRAFIAQMGADEFLVTGFDASVAFHLPGKLPGLRMQILRAEEGTFVEDGDHSAWQFLRLWNGDETDRGLNFRQHSTWVKVKIGKF